MAVWKGRRGWTRQWGWVIHSLVNHANDAGLHAKGNSAAGKAVNRRQGQRCAWYSGQFDITVCGE